MWSSGSPLAVGRKQTRGIGRRARPRMYSSSTALWGSIVKPPPPIAKMVRIGSGSDDEVSLVAQAHRLERGLARHAVDGLDAVRPRARPRADDAVDLAADEVQGGAVLGRVAGHHAVEHAREVLGPPARLAVVVHAVRPGQQAEPLDALRPAVEGGDRLREPAQRAGAQ